MGFIQDITLRLDGDLTKPYGEAKISSAGKCSALTTVGGRRTLWLMLLVCPCAVHNANDFSRRQSALFGDAHQPADGSALRVRCHACACCRMWARKVSQSLSRIAPACKVGFAAYAEHSGGELGHRAILVPAERYV